MPPEAPTELLTPTERIAYRVADGFVRGAPAWNRLWQSVVPPGLLMLAGGRRLRIRGLEHVAHLDKDDKVLLVANHRSLYDFFVIGSVLGWRTKLPRRTLYPVKSTFFYDHPLGAAINWAVCHFAMFPPIVRDPKRRDWNRYAVSRCQAELSRPGTLVGVHPEGQRNKDPDPTNLLPPQPGVGQIILACPDAHVIPVFVTGMGNDLLQETRRNFLEPSAHPIELVLGPEIDMSDLHTGKPRLSTAMKAARRSLEAIQKLADETCGKTPSRSASVEAAA